MQILLSNISFIIQQKKNPKSQERFQFNPTLIDQLREMFAAQLPNSIPEAALEILAHNLNLLAVGTLHGHQDISILETRLQISFFEIPDQRVRLCVRRLWIFWRTDFEVDICQWWRGFDPLSDEVLLKLLEMNRIVADPQMRVDKFLHYLSEYAVAKHAQGAVRVTQSVYDLRRKVMNKLKIDDPRPPVQWGLDDILFGSLSGQLDAEAEQNQTLLAEFSAQIETNGAQPDLCERSVGERTFSCHSQNVQHERNKERIDRLSYRHVQAPTTIPLRASTSMSGQDPHITRGDQRRRATYDDRTKKSGNETR